MKTEKKITATEGTKLTMRANLKVGEPTVNGRMYSEACIRKALKAFNKERILPIRLGVSNTTAGIDRKILVGSVRKTTILKNKSLSFASTITNKKMADLIKSGELRATITGIGDVGTTGRVKNYVLTCVSLIPKKDAVQ